MCIHSPAHKIKENKASIFDGIVRVFQLEIISLTQLEKIAFNADFDGQNSINLIPKLQLT